MGIWTLQRRKADLALQGYTIFSGWPGSSKVGSHIMSSVKALDGLPGNNIHNIYRHLRSTFPIERKLWAEETRDVSSYGLGLFIGASYSVESRCEI